ncbi:MAG: hypothetical protein ACW99G_08030 [Candidatus Thorarchaeota archaeon]|jgi:uncharacterized membrane protein
MLLSLHQLLENLWALTTNALIVTPAAGESLDPPLVGKLMGSIMKRFRRVVYISILIIIITGAIITSIMEPAFINLATEWGIVSLIKHIVIAITVIAVLYSFEVLSPKVAKLAAQGPSPELAQLQKVQMNVAKVGLVMALVILFLVGLQTAL